MTDAPRANPHILKVPAYHSGGVQTHQMVKLSSNENPWGCSDAARKAYLEMAHSLHRYPSSGHEALRHAIAARNGLQADQIIIGNGSDEIFTFIAQAYSTVGDEVIVTAHGFSMYRISALAAGATPIEVEENNRRVDVEAILRAVNERTKIIFVANPGNPTGTLIENASLEHLAASIPRHIVLVLDGAYAEFAPEYDAGAALVDRYPNIVMTRTFSKAYGLGGLRIGWGYANLELIEALNRLRGPFNINAAGLAAAQAAVEDIDFLTKTVEENARLRTKLRQEVQSLGLQCDESYANFILVRFKGPTEAEEAFASLEKAGYLTRKVHGYGFPEALRISIGTQSDCDGVIKALKDFCESLG